MASEWRATALGEVTDFLSGGTPSKGRADYWTGSIPWVSAKDMKKFRLDDTEDHVSEAGVINGTRLVPADSVLLLARGMTLLNDLPICVIKRSMTFNQDVKALKPKPNVCSEYLPYLLLGNKGRLLSLVDLAGHGTGRLNSDELKALEILLPPLPEQRAIAHILGTLDDKIELNRRMNETLEAMARALFKSWFVDFLPVRAKAGNAFSGTAPGSAPGSAEPQLGSTPTPSWGSALPGNTLPGNTLPKHIADLFPDKLVDSELGEIPEGWRVGTLGEVIDIFDSKRVPLSGREREQRKGPYPYHGAASVMDFVDDYLFDGIYILMGEDGSVINQDGTPVTQICLGEVLGEQPCPCAAR